MAGFSNILFVLPIIYLVNQIDFTQPQNVLYLRAIFVVVHTAIFIVIAKIYTSITAQHNQTKVKLPTGEEVTVEQHDLSEVKSHVKQMLITLGIIGFLHFNWELIPPLAVQCVMNSLNLYNTQFFKYYILNDRSEATARPWVKPSPFAALSQPAQEENQEDNKEQEKEKEEKKSKSEKKEKLKKAD